ncbi:lipoprotein insertase outer membrane protein LolB [Carnimonas bestiolae]|uniref:lipoprotein insertase outer membrane protein LolB n=1 Tax=Carnimonas bestiolae TaxID=3402172 RepID=UPI003EDC0B0F
MNHLRVVIAFIAALVISGCAVSPPSPSVDREKGDWEHQQQRLEALNDWQLSGKIGLRSPQQNRSANLDWTQHDADYTIMVSGPFGVGRNTLQGHPGDVTLKNGDGTFSAATPEQLMEQQLGWSLPVSSLDRWVRGLAANGSEGTFSHDDEGFPATLKQDGWTINYLQWSYADGYWLPGRLRLAYGDIQVTFVITRWQPQLQQQNGDNEGAQPAAAN